MLAAGVGAAFLASPVGAEQVPYRMDASNQAGWWKPVDEVNGSVYLAYNAWGSRSQGGANDTHTVYVARRDPSGLWTRGCLKSSAGACVVFNDDIGHNQPTLAVDGDGYIHVFASMHQVPWRYYRSNRPGDVTSMVDRSATMPDQGHPITYPNATRTVTGDIFLIVRDLRDGRLYRWDNTANTWTRAATFAQDPAYVVYPDDVIADAAGNVHIAWEWAYNGANGLRHLGSYLRYQPATGQFTAAAGTKVAAPATHATKSAIYQPLEPGEADTDVSSPTNPPGFQSAKLVLDTASGYPTAAYRFRPTAGGRFEVRLAEWDGAAWKRTVVYAGRYTTYAAIDVTIRGGTPRVYYAKTAVPSGNQAFAAKRQPDGRWVESLLLAGVPVERLAVVPRGNVDYVYLSTPSLRQLNLEVK
ncbi:MAG: BNR-4 repeat-containing protein [Jiangellaceae bacterium]